MSHRRIANTSPSLRFLGQLNDGGADGEGVQELELDERDVVWSSSGTSIVTSSSSTSVASSPSPSASLRRPASTSSSRHFPAGNSVGLSALLADGHAPTTAISARRQPPAQPYHQSAPVAVPAWPKGRTTTDLRHPALAADNSVFSVSTDY